MTKSFLKDNMDRDEGMKRLARKGWLGRVDAEFRTTLLQGTTWRHFESGEHLTLAGDEEGDLIGLAEGFVAFHVSYGQPSSPILHMAPPVFWMGYRPVITDDARIATATAASPVWCATIPRRTVRTMLEKRPDWWRSFVLLSLEYGDTAAMCGADLLITNSQARLIAVLLRFAGLRGPDGPPTPVLVPVTQQELASAANLSRNWAGTILRKLSRTGHITTGYNGITVHHAPALMSLLASSDR